MKNFQNKPQMKDSEGNILIPRYVHQELEFDYFGTHFKIHSDGRVTIATSEIDSNDPNEVVVDEINISAKVVFKIAEMLQMTRKIVHVKLEKKEEVIPEEKE